MAMFYFDTDDGIAPVTDDDGVETDASEVEALALRALLEMAMESVQQGADRFSVSVRSHGGDVVFSAQLALEVRRPG